MKRRTLLRSIFLAPLAAVVGKLKPLRAVNDLDLAHQPFRFFTWGQGIKPSVLIDAKGDRYELPAGMTIWDNNRKHWKRVKRSYKFTTGVEPNKVGLKVKDVTVSDSGRIHIVNSDNILIDRQDEMFVFNPRQT